MLISTLNKLVIIINNNRTNREQSNLFYCSLSYQEFLLCLKMNNLPDDLLENIFERVSLKDVLTCTCVCSHWNQIINKDIFWKRFMYKHFEIESSEEQLESSVIEQ